MKILLRILWLSWLTSLMSTAFAQKVVSIPDPGLNAGILAALGKASVPLTVQDMLRLTNLGADGRDVMSLDGLGAAHNLTDLDLGYNKLTNVSVLSELTSLTTLGLYGNQLTNVSVLSGLTGLTYLDLGQNQMTNLTLPLGLTSLSALGLDDNQLTSLTLLAGLTSLTTLYLDFNPLTTLVLPEPLAVTRLAVTVAGLRNQGVSIYTYPLAMSLVSPTADDWRGLWIYAHWSTGGLRRSSAAQDLAVWEPTADSDQHGGCHSPYRHGKLVSEVLPHGCRASIEV